MRNRFNIFAAEEFDDSVVDGQGQVSETPVADQIESENSAVEINNEISTFEEHCDEICNATEVADELQEQVDTQEEILEEKPEDVTEDTVAVAQEQFYITMSKIGSLQHYKTSGTISHEISAGTPTERLKLTCEGVKDFINTAWEKIKAFFNKIINWFKSILQKIGILKKDTEKSVETLKTDVAQVAKENDVQEAEVIESTAEFVQNVIEDKPVVLLLEDKSKTTKPANEAIGEEKVNSIKAGAEALVKSIGLLHIIIPNLQGLDQDFAPGKIVASSAKALFKWLKENYTKKFIKLDADFNTNTNIKFALNSGTQNDKLYKKFESIHKSKFDNSYGKSVVKIIPSEVTFLRIKINDDGKLVYEKEFIKADNDNLKKDIDKNLHNYIKNVKQTTLNTMLKVINEEEKNSKEIQTEGENIEKDLKSLENGMKAKIAKKLNVKNEQEVAGSLVKLTAETLTGLIQTFQSNLRYYKNISKAVDSFLKANPNLITK